MSNDKPGSTAPPAGGDPTLAPTVAATPGDASTPTDNRVQSPHPNVINLWAGGIKTPLRFEDNDGRLPDPPGPPGPGEPDRTCGQASWPVTLEFKDFAHLGDLLGGGQFTLPSFACHNAWMSCGPIEENQIGRLAILAHGGPGAIDIDGNFGRDLNSGTTDSSLLNASTLPRYGKQFDQILKVLAFRARVFFMCCMTGAGAEGDDFLAAVSNLWAAKEIFVIGYKSVLYCGGQQAKPGSSGASSYPGARETHFSNAKPDSSLVRPYEKLDQWNDVGTLPWASEFTPHATQVFRGLILKKGQDGNPWGAAPAP